MNVKNIKIRLNLDKEDDRKAYDILRHSEKSMSKFVIAAVNAYGSYLSTKEEQDSFLQRVNDSLRQTLQEMFGTALMGAVPAQKSVFADEFTQKVVDGSGEIADEFMENFI